MLEEKYRKELDGIVAELQTNNRSDEEIQSVVNDFKSKNIKQEPQQQDNLLMTETPDTEKQSFGDANFGDTGFSGAVGDVADVGVGIVKGIFGLPAEIGEFVANQIIIKGGSALGSAIGDRTYEELLSANQEKYGKRVSENKESLGLEPIGTAQEIGSLIGEYGGVGAGVAKLGINSSKKLAEIAGKKISDLTKAEIATFAAAEGAGVTAYEAGRDESVSDVPENLATNVAGGFIGGLALKGVAKGVKSLKPSERLRKAKTDFDDKSTEFLNMKTSGTDGKDYFKSVSRGEKPKVIELLQKEIDTFKSPEDMRANFEKTNRGIQQEIRKRIEADNFDIPADDFFKEFEEF